MLYFRLKKFSVLSEGENRRICWSSFSRAQLALYRQSHYAIHVAQSKAASEPADAFYAHLNPISALLFVNALGMPSEFLEQIVEHNITMDEVSLADQVSIPVIAKGAVVLSNR